MVQRILGIFVMVMALGAAVQADSASGVAVLPSGSTTVPALFAASRDLLKRTGYEVEGTLEEGRIRASATYYDTVSAAGGPGSIAKSTLSWTLAFRTEKDGRIVMTLDYEAEGARPSEDLPQFARNLMVGAGVSPAKVLLTFEGETKPLTQWKRRASSGM